MRDNALILDQIIGTIAKDNVDIVAHDMGDKVLTEYLKLRHEGEFSKEKKIGSIVFTNGGLINDLVNMR